MVTSSLYEISTDRLGNMVVVKGGGVEKLLQPPSPLFYNRSLERCSKTM
jgi:hypothetical protein